MSMQVLKGAGSSVTSGYVDTRSVGSKTVPIRVTCYGNTAILTIYDIPDLGTPQNKIQLGTIAAGSGTLVLDEPTNAIQVVTGAGETNATVYLDFSR